MAHWEICAECGGEGKHAHAIDGNGITESEWSEWDYEEHDAYFSGAYDRACEACDGSGKYQVPDEGDTVPCAECDGTGCGEDGEPCEECEGTGKVEDDGYVPKKIRCAGCSRKWSDDPMACECCDR